MSDGGLRAKFHVERLDPEAQERHQGCFAFVLDVDHDRHTWPALMAYAMSCREENPDLCADIMQMVRMKMDE